jgi:endonuclease YncB( thermonuclease family)
LHFVCAETKKPRAHVECFGREASARAHELLAGRTVRLALDEAATGTGTSRSRDGRDRYGRLLRRVLIQPADEDFGLAMVRDGFAWVYPQSDNARSHQHSYQHQNMHQHQRRRRRNGMPFASVSAARLQSAYAEAEAEAATHRRGLWHACDGQRRPV